MAIIELIHNILCCFTMLVCPYIIIQCRHTTLSKYTKKNYSFSKKGLIFFFILIIKNNILKL